MLKQCHDCLPCGKYRAVADDSDSDGDSVGGGIADAAAGGGGDAAAVAGRMLAEESWSAYLVQLEAGALELWHDQHGLIWR